MTAVGLRPTTGTHTLLLHSKFPSLSSVTLAGLHGLPDSVARVFIPEEPDNHTIGNQSLLRLQLLHLSIQGGKGIPGDAQLHHKDSIPVSFLPLTPCVKVALSSPAYQG